MAAEGIKRKMAQLKEEVEKAKEQAEEAKEELKLRDAKIETVS
jgi:ribosome-interacting GTPase 1